MVYRIQSPGSTLHGKVKLEGSKSISNRVLIIRALCDEDFEIRNLSPSNDTTTLNSLLKNPGGEMDCGAAGTTFRFLSSFLARSSEQALLTGSERMKQRPIGILVDALRQLGAEIEYVDKEGYPPLNISGRSLKGGSISIPAHVSSQYISSLLLVAPSLDEGLSLELIGKVGSRPYIEMTLRIMEYFGAKWSWEANVIRVEPGAYEAKTFDIESDWSAASYYFSALALARGGGELEIEGLQEKSLQGDSVLPQIYEKLGVQSTWKDGILHLKQQGNKVPQFLWDFSDCPDLAQTVAVSCAGLEIPLDIEGVESLRIKETDRTAALQAELSKFSNGFNSGEQEHWVGDGAFRVPEQTQQIATYEDHRMAMCFAPLSQVLPQIEIQEPNVVAKSYPSFWEDFKSLGFEVTEV